ncbi:ran-specific GTPase-activating protein-like [Centruroides sculpturatus]|uniref:ran-specific GTPase-activating protein-like n=1 Tax=Centruroides sculpturatus TaxID=218467 RepID=UPI000C6CFB59|nr:ran-specific GTPase-activating protein-like [Centruroides sculpturatus]
MGNDQEEVPESPDVHFEPVMKLPLVETKTMEEDEEELVKLRAKLFRYDTKDTPAEWKERGTGEVKILRHKKNNSVRIVMRRDKTLKICANHYIQPLMEMNPKSGSDKALVWSTPADYADEEPKSELLAIKFASAENCLKFKESFEKAKLIVSEKFNSSIQSDKSEQDEEDDDEGDESNVKEEKLASKIEALSLNQNDQDAKENTTEKEEEESGEQKSSEGSK